MGVDVESLAAPDEARRLARRIVTPQEATAIEGLSGRPLQRAVLRLWTRKEAWAKATGAGLGAGLDRLEVPIGADQWGVRLASTEPWWLFALRGPDFDDLDAALVVSGDKGEGAPTVTVAEMHHAARS
ncbi:MAG TPA: 4'-phosphopantetheinyl transferase superfamily protein [Acidimicrobiales bacterium]